MINGIKRTLKLTAISACLAFASSTSMASSEKLTAQECSLIQGYNAIEGNDFVDHFSKMVHQVEHCQRTGGVCEVPLRKRVEDYYLILNQPKSFKSEQLAVAAENQLNIVLSDISTATGITHIFEKPSGTNKYIFVVFVEPEIVAIDYEKYLKEYITRPTFSGHAWRKKMFDHFLASQQPCMGMNPRSKDNITRSQHIWMRSDLDEATTRRCISEEFYNLFGLDEGVEVASIFDYTFDRSPEDNSLSDFDLLKLKILYRNEFKPGISKVQTRRIAERLIADECVI